MNGDDCGVDRRVFDMVVGVFLWGICDGCDGGEGEVESGGGGEGEGCEVSVWGGGVCVELWGDGVVFECDGGSDYGGGAGGLCGDIFFGRFWIVGFLCGWNLADGLGTEQERLPYKEGWRPPKVQTTLATLGVMAGELNAANREPVPEGLILGASTLKMAWHGLDPITGVQASA